MVRRVTVAVVVLAFTMPNTTGDDDPSSASELRRAAKKLDDGRQLVLQQAIDAVLASDEKAKDAAVANLVRKAQQLNSLAGQIRDFRIREAGRSPASQSTTDLLLLRRQILVDRASLLLTQTELFPPTSMEAIAAAVKAEAAIQDAIQQIPVGSAARRELHRLHVDAVLRSGQIDRARADFDRWMPNQKPLSPAWLALRARIEIALGNESAAGRVFGKYLGSDVSSVDNQPAPASIDIDLARLEYLLTFNQTTVGAWIETIRQRHGDYVFRRAQAILLSRSPESKGDLSSDPTWLTAKANELLQSGKQLRAGAMLAKASLAETDADRALQRATEAAAILVSIDQQPFAADTLIQTARKHTAASAAPTAHLQAIHILSGSSNADRVEKLLKDQLQDWPRGMQAESARDWLYQLLSDQGRLVEAAESVSQRAIGDWNSAKFGVLSNAWRSAFHQAPDNKLGDLSRRFRRSTRTMRESREGRSKYRALAAMLIDRDHLVDLPDDIPSDPFIEALIQFRRDGIADPALESPPSQWIGDVRWRLIRDARRSARQRLAIAKLLQSWENDGEPSLQALEIQLWLSQTLEAIRIGNHLIAASNQDFDVIVAVADLLGTSERPKAIRTAIGHWDQIAAGTNRGSRLWHRAKTSAIKCLRKLGDHETANRRCRYILLTVSDIDPNLRHMYEPVSP